MNRTSRLSGALVALALFGASCSGGGGESEGLIPRDLLNDAANAPVEQIDEASGGVASGPIKGLLTVQNSFGFGVFDIDPDTGLAAAVPAIAEVESIGRNDDFIVVDGAAYALGTKVREGQSFANDVSVVKIDYATGQVSQVVALGFERETDDSEGFTSYNLVAVTADRVVVSSRIQGTEGNGTFTVYDATTGEQRSSFPSPTYEFTFDNGSCQGGVGDFVGLSDGRLAGVGGDTIAYVDLDSGDVDLAVSCDDPEPEFSDFVTVDQVVDYTLFAPGPVATPEQLERLLDTELEPDYGFVEGDGDLWWIQVNNRQVDDVRAAVGGIVQFDIATGTVEAVHPLGLRLGEYIDCESGEPDCYTLDSIPQAQLHFIDGRLLLLDNTENGTLLTFDPASGEVAETVFELGDGVDYTRADLLVGQPGEVWVDVTRFTITKDDETGRQASGPSYIEHFDLATNQIDLSLASEELFF